MDASAGRLLDVCGYYQDGKASEIDGNVSSCMRCLFEHFINECSMSIEDGLTLELNPPTMVFFRFSKYIADEAALSRLWSTKTAAGVVPCIRCLNCVSISSGFDKQDLHGERGAA